MAKKITKAQAEEIRKLSDMLNKRIKRATPGQRAYLERYVKHATGGETFFSRGTKGLTYTQAAHRIEQMKEFAAHRSTTTRKGWKALKEENVRRGNEALGTMGYNLTDEEFAEILMQIDASNKVELYRVVNLVYTRKNRSPDAWKSKSASDQISSAVSSKISAKKAAQLAIDIRNRNK